ncbi:MAG: S-layer homology domain-containing protein [Clostridia bacterium]|nr:S-layer homology domain-containing protein [Clostridia bacterium]
MKMLRSLLCIALTFAMLIPVSVFAGPLDYIVENEPVAAPEATPDIDGVISDTDGWSAPAKLKDGMVKYLMDYAQPCATDADIYFAYDEGGLYFAADITEISGVGDVDNTFAYSTEEDYLDLEKGSNENIVGYNGDVFILALDPLGLYEQNGYIAATDYTVWYCVGLFENEGAKLYRTRANAGEATDGISLTGKTTETGWCFEAYLPWEMIIADMEAYTYGRATCTVEDLTQGGAQFRSAAIYMDRTDDPELGEVNTRGAYMTACSVAHDGHPSHTMKGHYAMLYGLDFYIEYKNPAFNDVKENAWYYEAVKYCFNHRYMNGTSDNAFTPNGKVTREMFVKVLANLADADLSGYSTSSFTDVKEGSWYATAVEWAYDNGLTSGMSEDSFGTGQAITREQLAAFLTRFAQFTKKNTNGRADLSIFKDSAKISDWAKDSVSWMVYKGFISGMDETTLDPKGTATRAQMAVLITAYMGEYGLNVF